MRPKRFSEMSGTANPATHYHITEAAILQSTGKLVMISYTKYMHFPNASVPSVITMNKKVIGHFNAAPSPLPIDVLIEHHPTASCIFRVIHVLRRIIQGPRMKRHCWTPSYNNCAGAQLLQGN